MDNDLVKLVRQSDRDEFVERVLGLESNDSDVPPGWYGTFRKRARILAERMAVEFEVETDRGPMRGHPGDWLATNHPDDDPGSDLWTISAERMESTYEPVYSDGDEMVAAWLTIVREIEATTEDDAPAPDAYVAPRARTKEG